MFDEPSYVLLSFLSEFFVGFGGAFGRGDFPAGHFFQLETEAESTPDSRKSGLLQNLRILHPQLRYQEMSQP